MSEIEIPNGCIAPMPFMMGLMFFNFQFGGMSVQTAIVFLWLAHFYPRDYDPDGPDATGVTADELAFATRLTRSGISRIIDRLGDKGRDGKPGLGLVAEFKSDRDSRKVYYTLSPKGWTAFLQWSQHLAETLDEIASQIDAG